MNMHAIIVGPYDAVYYLCRIFIAKGYKVTVINRDEEECKKLAHQFKATVVLGDGSAPQILEEAGAYTADIILAITPNDQDNLLICQLGQIHFNVPRALAIVNDPDNEEIFRKLGVSAVSFTRMLSKLIEQRTSFEEIVNLFPISEGKINVTEVALDSSSPVIEKSLQEIKMPANSLIVSIIRNGKAIIPDGTTLLKEKDRLVVITLPENHGQVLRFLTGDKI
jgi:trk system potassium uptake protein TrkA